MKKILVIGEKSSQIRKFKDVLLQNSASNQEFKGIYSYTGLWKGNLDTYEVKMVPLRGHISKIDTPKEFGWGQVDPIEIVKNPKALIFKEDYNFRNVLSKNALVDELYIATDPDSEGDNIGYEAYKILIRKNPKLSNYVRRIWNSSLTNTEIRRAFLDAESKLGWDTRLALSVQGRQLADAWLGFAGTREITISARKIHKIRVFSVGRVQLPTLKMIVDRDIEHESFIPKPLWNLQAKLISINKEQFVAEHENNPFENENQIKEKIQNINSIKVGRIHKLDKNTVKRRPPAPLNTTAALSLLARIFKLKADKGLEMLSDLYLEGLLSYPRTENGRFTENFPHKEILTKLNKIEEYSDLISNIPNSTDQVRTNGKKKGVEDHDPIHPTGQTPKLGGKITEIHIKVLNHLTQYYIGMFMNDLVIDKMKVTILIKSDKFISEGKIVSSLGWTKAIHWMKIKDELLPVLTEGDTVNIDKLTIKKSQTKPKPRFSDIIILKQMEKLGLGTKSSRPSILEKLVERRYIVRNKIQIISQIPGRTLIQLLDPIWPKIVTNQFTKSVEKKMDDVAIGHTSYQKMIDELRSYYLENHLLLKNNLSIFESSLKTIDFSVFGESSKYKNKFPKTKEKEDDLSNEACPSCQKGFLIKRKNKTSGDEFFGCSDYPNCKFTKPIKSQTKKRFKKSSTTITKKENPIKIGSTCPRCNQGRIEEKINQDKNIKYLGCSRYPNCRYSKILS